MVRTKIEMYNIMNNSNKVLQTGWKTWDRYLGRYVGKKVNIMEIGVFEGEATKWFLTNILTDNESKMYAIDTFGGSPEYLNKVNFTNVEKKFHDNIKSTGREKQVVVMKMFSDKALMKLLMMKDSPRFDIIFIDASHEARDVIVDAVLAWKLLKEEGTMIFDDYGWKKIKQPYFRPKMAIDAFIDIMKPELRILAIKYQALIRKKKEENFTPVLI